MTKKKAIIWITIFILVIATPFFIYPPIRQYIDTENYENRSATLRPELTIENYDSFAQNYEEYFNDNIPFRNQLIELNSKIDYFLFHQSSSEKVLIGQNGWLFYPNNEDYNPVEQSLGYWKFTEEELQKITNNLIKARDILKHQGIEFVLFIPSNKESIYQEELPGYFIQKEEKTSAEQLVDYLRQNTDIRVVYPYDELMEARHQDENELLYYKLDTHWNRLGAYIGAQELVNELGCTLPDLNMITIETHNIDSGDLTNLLHIKLPDGDKEYTISGYSNLNTLEKKMDMATEFIYETPGADARKILVERDSFATNLAPFVASQFEYSYFVNANVFDATTAFKEYAPDIFVYEIVERHISELKDFTISYINSNVKMVNDRKEILIKSAFQPTSNQYISIFKESSANQEITQIAILEMLQNDVKIEVPQEETGTIYAYVFDDKQGNNILEEIKIEY